MSMAEGERDEEDEEGEDAVFVPLEESNASQYRVLDDLTGTAGDVDLDEDIDDDNEDEQQLPPAPRDDASATSVVHSAPVFCIASPPSSNCSLTCLVSGAGDDSAALHSLREPAHIESTSTLPSTHSDSIASLSFNADGTLFASASLDGSLSVWRSDSHSHFHLLHLLEGPDGGIESVCWHPKGDVVLAGSEDFTAWMWSASDGCYMGLFSGHHAAISECAFTRDGKGALTASADGTVRLWQPKTGECFSSVTAQEAGAVTCMHTHPNGSLLITGGEDGSACIVSISGDVPSRAAKLNRVSTLEGASMPIESVGFCPSQPIAAVASHDGHTRLYDVNTSTLRSTCAQTHRCTQHAPEHAPESGTAAVTAVAWNPTAPALLATAGSDGAVMLWDARTGASVATLLGHSQAVLDLCFTASGNALFTASDDHQCKLFDVRVAVGAR